jgi:hypothetical protein
MASQMQNFASIAIAKAPARTQTASTKLTATEFAELESVAAGKGLSPGEWIREVLLRETERALGREPVEMILVEIVGLQLFLTNALAPIARGEKIDADQYQELMRQVKANKHRAAREVIAQHALEKKEQLDD